MAADTNVDTLIINKMTEEQYKGLATKSPTELYLTPSPEYAEKAGDFITPITNTNKGATKTEIDALDDKIDIASTSGKIIGSYWFGKTKADTAVPAPTLPGQNYYDFTTSQVYKSADGATWTLDSTNTPPSDIDAQIVISSKFWDITEQDNQHGGKAWWSHTNSKWSYSPTIYEDKPAGGASLPLLTRLIPEHKFNDVSYLDANTFSWQSGGVYSAVYQHLVEDFNGASGGERSLYAWTTSDSAALYGTVYTDTVNVDTSTFLMDDMGEEARNLGVSSIVPNGFEAESEAYGGPYTYTRDPSKDVKEPLTETIDGITIQYYLAQDGHRICLPDQESAVSSLYAKTGEANFFILDTTNAQFKLPRTQKRKLIRAVKNGDGTWYNLYSDGWVEQGGVLLNASTGAHQIIIPIEMRDVNELKYSTKVDFIFISGSIQNQGVGVDTGRQFSTTSFSCFSWGATGHIGWQVQGYASDTVLANEPVQYEYYYVGNFEQTAIEQTAGLNAELFNNKVDVGHQVIEFQAPTAANNYTWYRKYADGWVEQGGVTVGSGAAASGKITLPITMSSNEYTINLTAKHNYAYACVDSNQIPTTTAFYYYTVDSSAEGYLRSVYWQVSGMAA